MRKILSRFLRNHLLQHRRLVGPGKLSIRHGLAQKLADGHPALTHLVDQQVLRRHHVLDRPVVACVCFPGVLATFLDRVRFEEAEHHFADGDASTAAREGFDVLDGEVGDWVPEASEEAIVDALEPFVKVSDDENDLGFRVCLDELRGVEGGDVCEALTMSEELVPVLTYKWLSGVSRENGVRRVARTIEKHPVCVGGD